MEEQRAQATFAGGCFWCIQGPYDHMEAVYGTQAGYAGGAEEDASYYTVVGGGTGHREAVQVEYDPSKVEYRELVETFFRQIDPTDEGGQFADRGFQYTTAVYAHTPEQRTIAEEYIAELNASGKFDAPVATVVEDFSTFFPAEEEHQRYYEKNPVRYGLYKRGSGREGYIQRMWKEE